MAGSVIATGTVTVTTRAARGAGYHRFRHLQRSGPGADGRIAISTRIPPKHFAVMVELAKVRNVSVAQLIRDFIEMSIEIEHDIAEDWPDGLTI